MSLSSVDCKHCNEFDASHLCWKHSKSVTGCRLVQHKWAPSRCRDCILAIAKMVGGTSAEKKRAFQSYSVFLKGLRSFVDRVSVDIVHFSDP